MSTGNLGGRKNQSIGNVILFPVVDWRKASLKLEDFLIFKLQCGLVLTGIPKAPVVQAYVNYAESRIEMSGKIDSKEHLMGLLHAAGHWVHYLRNMKNKPPPKDTRERMAYYYGWAVAKHLELPIVRKDWIWYHDHARCGS